MSSKKKDCKALHNSIIRTLNKRNITTPIYFLTIDILDLIIKKVHAGVSHNTQRTYNILADWTIERPGNKLLLNIIFPKLNLYLQIDWDNHLYFDDNLTPSENISERNYIKISEEELSDIISNKLQPFKRKRKTKHASQGSY